MRVMVRDLHFEQWIVLNFATVLTCDFSPLGTEEN